MPSSAELPIFNWDGNRRDFLRGAVRLTGGAAGTIYLAPLLAGCSPTNDITQAEIAGLTLRQNEIPQRIFNTQWMRWKSEQELAQRDYLLGHVATLDKGVLTVEDINGGTIGRLEVPGAINAASNQLDFSPDSNKIAISTTFGNPISHASVLTVELPGFHSWSPLNTLPGHPFVAPVWSHDSKQIAMNVSDMGRIIYLMVSDYKGGSVIAGRPVNFTETSINLPKVGGFMKFSPDNRLVAHDSDRTVSIWETETGKKIRVGEGYVVGWLPDGKSLLFRNNNQELLTYSLETQRTRKIASLIWFSPIHISTDGQFVYATRNLARNYYELDKIPVQNSDELLDSVPLHSFSVDFSQGDLGWTPQFMVNSQGEMLIADYRGSHKPIRLFRVNMESGKEEELPSLSSKNPDGTSVGVLGFVPDDLFLYDKFLTGNNGEGVAEVFAFSFTTGIHKKIAQRTVGNISGVNAYSIYSLGEGGVIEQNGTKQVIKSGRRYDIPANLLNHIEDPVYLPEQFAGKIPESENKLDFGSGDILVGPGGRAWYLQNGGRYEIPGRIEDFVQNRHKNMRAFEVPSWVLEKISTKEMPSRFFEDQYGRLIDGQAARFLFFISGWGSNSEQPRRDFNEIIRRLSLLGWSDEQIVFGTYNFSDGKPYEYESRHSKQFTGLSRDALRHNVGWLKQRAPLSQTAICGHSQGADMAVQAAITHADYVSQAVSICGPLKGVDRAFVNRIIDLDSAGNFLGDAATFYVNAGEDLSYGEQAETGAQVLERRNVELYTFGEFYDGFVKPEMAILKNSRQELNGRKIDLLWRTNITSDPLDAHGVLLKHEPFVELLAQIFGRAA